MPGASTRLSETVYQDLRARIYAFRLLPGDRFAETDVAERLAVSRTPVREALMRLQSEGLVRGHYRNGWEVVPIDFARFAALYELRTVLEVHAARRLCDAAAEAARRAFLAVAEPVWGAVGAQRPAEGLEVAELDEDFHRRLVTAVANPEIDVVYRQVTERIRILRRLDFAYGDCVEETYAEHRAILAALESADAARAAALVASHIESSQVAVRQISVERLEQARTESVRAPPPATPPPARRKRFR